MVLHIHRTAEPLNRVIEVVVNLDVIDNSAGADALADVRVPDMRKW